MAALTLGTLNTQVRDLVGDPLGPAGTGNNTFSDPQVTDAINYACQWVCTRLGYSYQEADITAVTPWSSFSMANLTQDYVEIRRVMLKNTTPTPNTTTELLKSSYAEEDVKNPVWKSVTCDMVLTFPRRWVLQDGKTIVLYPRPIAAYPAAGTTVTLTIGYVQQPTILVLTTDTVDARIPWPVQIYLKYVASAWLKQLSGRDITDLNQAKEWMAMFEQFISGGGAA